MSIEKKAGKMKRILILAIVLIALTSCATPSPSDTVQTPPTSAPVSTNLPQVNMANPASVYCEQQGNKLEIRTAADGSQSGVCIFPDGSECEEWAYFRGECPVVASPTSTSLPADTEISTAIPIDPAGYLGWWTYTHAAYNFSIKLPEDWVVDETTVGDPLMNGHMLMLHPQITTGADLNIRMTFQRKGEGVPLWPTGVGAGEFVPQGTLDIVGQPARRVLFVCPTGQVNEIWYHDAGELDSNIQRGNMELGFILAYTGVYCQEGYSLSGKLQWLGEMIIASLATP